MPRRRLRARRSAFDCMEPRDYKMLLVAFDREVGNGEKFSPTVATLGKNQTVRPSQHAQTSLGLFAHGIVIP